MTLKAVIHEADEGGFWAEVPALPGCVTQGETIAEIKDSLREAIDAWLLIDEECISTISTDSGDQILELTV